jgi:hypothetical protein
MRLAMATLQTQKVNRRKQQRHPRLLRISWRMLGNRDFRFGEAHLKDISTGGLAMHVDASCRKGTVVIVQMDGLPEPFFGPWLLQAAWSRELPAQNGKPAYLMGCSFTSPLQEKELEALLEAARKVKAAPVPAKAPAAKAPSEVDPFVTGSAGEKRRSVRRKGLVVPVVLCRTDGGPRLEAMVVDRSLQGLRILCGVAMPRGTRLKVRPRDVHDEAHSVEVEVRNCIQKGHQFHLGCEFSRTPNANLLLQFG